MVYLNDFLLGGPVWRIHELFNLDGENSISTWFSIVQLFLIGFISLLVAFSQTTTPPPSKNGLTFFGLGFIYLSMDEGSSIHEKMTLEFHNNPLVPYFDGVHGIWIVVYGCVGIITLIILRRDIFAVCKHFPKEALIFLGGMVIYLAGTGGAETITYFYIDKSNPFVYTAEVILEEFLEMSGASILLYSVLLLAIKKLEYKGPTHANA
jgi:hypothetical protein